MKTLFGPARELRTRATHEKANGLVSVDTLFSLSSLPYKRQATGGRGKFPDIPAMAGVSSGKVACTLRTLQYVEVT